MTKSANIEAIEKATGRSWEEWTEYLDGANAKDLPHKEIAEKVYQKLGDSQESASWWAQGITVAYEQHIGRRLPGQRSDGTFETAISKTINASMDDVIAEWSKLIKGKAEFDGVKIAKDPTTSSAEKRRHWGCGLEDGTRVNADTYPKSEDKTIFTITHTRLSSHEAADHWKAYWKTIIEEMGV